jgi:hypothetical protein
VNTAPPQISGTATVGNRLTCLPGMWAGGRVTTFRFLAGDTPVSTTSSLYLAPSLAGATVRCEVTVKNYGGPTTALTSPVTVSAPPAEAPAAPAPAPALPSVPPAPPRDSAAPTARVASVRCSRTTCLLQVAVDDAAPSAGVAAVEAKVTTTYRTHCGPRRHRRTCTKRLTRRLTPTRTGPSTFRIATPRLKAGTHTFSLVALDAAGNRQAKPTTLTRRTH